MAYTYRSSADPNSCVLEPLLLQQPTDIDMACKNNDYGSAHKNTCELKQLLQPTVPMPPPMSSPNLLVQRQELIWINKTDGSEWLLHRRDKVLGAPVHDPNIRIDIDHMANKKDDFVSTEDYEDPDLCCGVSAVILSGFLAVMVLLFGIIFWSDIKSNFLAFGYYLFFEICLLLLFLGQILELQEIRQKIAAAAATATPTYESQV